MTTGHIDTSDGKRIHYEHREDDGWYVHGDAIDEPVPFRFAHPNVSEGELREVLRKHYDPDH